MQLQTTGTKRLVGVQDGRVATAIRIAVSEDGKTGHGWLLAEDRTPIGVEPSWDKAATRLRSMGYRLRIEQV